VHCTYYWITEDDEFVGYLALRHALTPWLLEAGGQRNGKRRYWIRTR
jgi:predicted acetyltransferase